MSETELGEAVVAWLSDQKWDVYQEVQVNTYGAVADIVGTCGQKVCIVELKKSLGLSVLRQASHWSGHAHLIYVAVSPVTHRSRDFEFACKVAGMLGVGVLTASIETSYWSGEPKKIWNVSETTRAPFLRNTPYLPRLKSRLAEGHKTFAAAGNSHGRRWSPFQQTCMEIKRYVQNNPGATVKEVVAGTKHHYATPQTARSCIINYAQKGIIEGVRVEMVGRSIKLWPL